MEEEKMTEEQVTEQAVSETPGRETVLEAKQPEPTPEPISEVSSEAPETETKSVQERLAEEVKSCVVESRTCEGLGGKLDDAAKELGIPVGDLIDQVFRLISG